MGMDVKPQNDSHTSSLEDDEEFEEDDEKEQSGALRAGSLPPVGFLKNRTLNYSSFSEEELDEGGAQTRTGVLA